jgi:pimeloyl-ACP methyl ester carboxylesterase
MFVKQYGSGPDVYVGLHGWSGDHRTFDPMLPFLPDRATFYAVDLPGCGESAPPHNWTLADVSREISGALDPCSRPVTLVGNCIGALFGIHAAMDRPEAVARLVLIDAFAEWPWYFRVFTTPVWGKYAYASTFANPLGRWITNCSLVSRRAPDSNLTEGFARVNHDVALHYLNILREFRSPGEFAPLALPVDIVFGARSFRAVRQSAAVWREVWPWARSWELEGACHLPIREASAAVSEIVFGGAPCLQ